MSCDKRFQWLILPEIGNVQTFIMSIMLQNRTRCNDYFFLWSFLSLPPSFSCENLNHNLSKDFFLTIPELYMVWVLSPSMIKWGDALTAPKRETTSNEKLMEEKLSWSNVAKRRWVKKNCCVSCSVNEQSSSLHRTLNTIPKIQLQQIRFIFFVLHYYYCHLIGTLSEPTPSPSTEYT